MRAAVTVLALLLALGVARADDAEAKRHFERGVRTYNLQEFKIALDEFKAAYLEKSDPKFLFNIAQCQRNLGQHAAAARSYRAFLNSWPDAPNRAEVERLIAQMDDAAKVDLANQPPTGTMPSPPASAQQPPPVAVAQESSATPTSKWYRSPLGWTLTAGGAAVGVVGVGLLVHGNDLDSQIPGATSLAQAQQLGRDRDTFRVAGEVIIAVGGAALVAGIVVLVVRAAHHRPSNVSWLSSGDVLGGSL